MVVDGPAIIEVVGGTFIHIDADRNVFIDGFESLQFKSAKTIDLDAETISLRAKDKIYIGSDKHLEFQTKRIDFCPRGDQGGYRRATRSPRHR